MREDLSPKLAYERLMSLIQGEWQTSVEGKTGEDGMFDFNGFYGTYDVFASIDDLRVRGRLDLSKNGEVPSLIIDLGKT